MFKTILFWWGLDIKDIVSIAKENKIDLIHPGYGFLSENPNFAKAVRLAGITYVGPDEKTLRLFGDKVLSKKLVSFSLIFLLKRLINSLLNSKFTFLSVISFVKLINAINIINFETFSWFFLKPQT